MSGPCRCTLEEVIWLMLLIYEKVSCFYRQLLSRILLAAKIHNLNREGSK